MDNNNNNDNNSNMMYSACSAWKSSSVERGGCSSSHINHQLAPKANSSWAVPTSLYDHSSLLECARCTQGSYMSYGGGGGVGQGSNIMDGELQYFEEEEEMCMGMEMKMMKKRKLTSEQARQLEASFEADKKLEAEKKQRLADQLGLQPRQVAVWFQNRRARSKTKQLEIDFLALKSEYDRVLAQRRALQAEIARLAAQLQDKTSGTKFISCSQESTSSTNSNNGDLLSDSTTLQIKMHTSTKEKDELTSKSCQENERNKECTPRLPDLSSKYPNIASYDWAHPYDDGLWVFD